MTTQAIGVALTQALALEKEARAYWQTATTMDERDAALKIVRHITPVIRTMEHWIAQRQAHAT